jgi:hypothetical protein
MGYNNIWFVAHLVVMIMVYFGGGHQTNKRKWHRWRRTQP